MHVCFFAHLMEQVCHYDVIHLTLDPKYILTNPTPTSEPFGEEKHMKVLFSAKWEVTLHSGFNTSESFFSPLKRLLFLSLMKV